MKLAWKYIIAEPFSWLFYCFFQPTKFKQDFEIKGFWNRIMPMLRLALPLFLISYFLALPTLAIPCGSIFHSTIGCYPNVSPQILNGNWYLALVTAKNTLLSTALTCVLGIAVGILWGITGGVALGIVWSITLAYAVSIIGEGYLVSYSYTTALIITTGVSVAITFGMIAGIVEGPEWGIIGSVVVGIIGGIAWGIARSTLKAPFYIHISIQSYLSWSAEVAFAFFLSYLLGYYRLPLSIVSGLLWLRTYFACRKKPTEVFTYLHSSPLYWDERTFLPLPGLKHTLLIAAEKNLEQALKEIAFIASKRPQQLGAAQAASLEIAIQDLEVRDTLPAIARASQRLAEILPQEADLIDPRWLTPTARLRDASRDAARYCGPFNWQAQRKALEDMIANLEQIHLNTSLRDSKLSMRMSTVVNMWRTIARNEKAKLEQMGGDIGYIDNPYNAGKVLESHDTLFVGRRDIVLQLSEALSKGNRCPPFLLNGERRMGKTSTLKQLPALLGGRYIPILYDLQSRGITSSTDIFLSTLAKEIYLAMNARGIRIKELKSERLREVSKKNEASIYQLFDEWLKLVEHVLKQQDHILLLLFDEFEKLDETEQEKYLNLNLLLDWFRNTIQNRSQLALLFSGVRTFSEMGAETGINWAGYFVNTQMLKVSFLRPAEAQHLITEPVPNFPSKQIFGEEVVGEIIRITGCHPFLVQAVCSALIDMLNIENRSRAEIQDVAIVMNQVLDTWEPYFRDLWQRTNQEQRVCLAALRQLSEGNPQEIQRISTLDEKTINYTLQALRKRDLVLLEESKYRIAAPIFSEWIERHK